jgi:hypothetical protein
MSTSHEHEPRGSVGAASDDEDVGGSELIFGQPQSVMREVARAAALQAAMCHIAAGRLRPSTDPVEPSE